MKSSLISGLCLMLAVGVSLGNDQQELPAWSVRLGWTLVHTLWQLAIVAVVAKIVSLALSRRSANVQYVCSTLALASMLVIPCVTWLLISVPETQTVRPSAILPTVQAIEPTFIPELTELVVLNRDDVASVPAPERELPPSQAESSELDLTRTVVVTPQPQPVKIEASSPAPSAPVTRGTLTEQVAMRLKPWLGFINTYWLMGVLLLSIRPLWGLWVQYRLRQVGLTGVPEELQGLLRELAQRMGIHTAVRIAVSSLVKVPMVVGYFRPIILLPASVVTGLAPSELESLLAHELAHIRRHDWIVNAMQVVIETLLFYHPAVWWLSNRIRHERELCCDDLALTLVQDKARYGRMLLALEELLHHSPSPVLAATGGDLVSRIRRLLPAAAPVRRTYNGWFAGFSLLLIMALAGGLSILAAQRPSLKIAQTSEDQTSDKAVETDKSEDPGESSTTDRRPAPPEAQSPAASSELDEEKWPASGTITIEAHDYEPDDPIIDLKRMSVNDSHWYTSFPVSRFCQDRWLRSRGYGDLTRGDDERWVGFRGTQLLVLDLEDLEEAAKIPVEQLKSRLAAEGRVHVAEEEFGTKKCLAIQTGDEEVYVARLQRPFPWSLKLEVRRLTGDADGWLDRPNEGLEAVAWGPVVDGLQAGICYRTRHPQLKPTLMIGDMILVKLFVRNASDEEKTYVWQLEDEFRHFDAAERAKRTKPILPIFHSWQPILVDAAGKPAIISPVPEHQAFQHHSQTLKPGEAVMIATAASTLWSAIDVDFGTADDRLNAIQVEPGHYRLSTEIDTRLVHRPRLRTGELPLEIVAMDPLRFKNYETLDSLVRQRKHFYGQVYWIDSNQSRRPDGEQNGTPTRRRSQRRSGGYTSEAPPARPLLGRSPVEYLTLPGLVTDEKTKRPIEGAVVSVEILAASDSWRPSLCQYLLTSDVDGRYEVKVPRKLLSGYSAEFTGTVQVTVTHPQYSHKFVGDDESELRKLGLIDQEGNILKQGKTPVQGKSTKESQVQRIALAPARKISGRLLGPTQQPLTNVQIYGHELTSIGFPSALVLEKTDSEGRFQMDVPASTTVYLEFRMGDLPSKEIKVLPSQTDVGDVIAGEGQKIRGQVLDAAGKPVGYVSLTAPPIPRPDGAMVMVIRADEQGRFESQLLPPGEYRLEVGDINRPEDEKRNSIRVSGPPPDLYLPYQFKVAESVPLPDVTLRPARNTIMTAKLVTTSSVNETTDNDFKGTDAFDVMLLKQIMEQPLKITVNGSPMTDVESGVTCTADPNTGKISIKGEPDSQWAMGLGFCYALSETPSFVVRGTLAGQPWSAQPKLPFLLDTPEAPDDPEADASTKKLPADSLSVKVPRDLKDVTVESSSFLQHLQFGDGPKLFGKSFRVPRLDAEHLSMTVYHYKATTLRVRLTDTDNQPIAMTENKLPEGTTIKARYTREEEVKQAGAIVEVPDGQTNVICDNEIYFFVLPGEEVEVNLSVEGKTATRRFTLQDGETRTAQLTTAGDFRWTESSKPTPRVEFELPE